MSSVATKALVIWAKEILSGAVKSPGLIIPPEVSDFLTRRYKERTPPPTDAALAGIAEGLALQAYYQGRVIAYHRSVDGTFTVLAVGGREIDALLDGLTEDEAALVRVTDTAPGS